MENISVREVKSRLQAGENLNLVDVREPEENAEFNIGGKLLPLGMIQSMQTEAIDDLKDEEVIVHCRSGKRSVTACMFLETLGFSNTVNVLGGVLDWQAKFGTGK